VRLPGPVALLYDMLPPPAAEAALSLYGLRNPLRERTWGRILRRCAASETWNEEEQSRYVSATLRTLLAHALTDVPRYRPYRSLLGELRGPDEHVVALLRELPVTTKAEVREDPTAFMAASVPDRCCIVSHTSGTTGTPLALRMTRNAVAVSDALWWRRAIWAGYRRGDSEARLVLSPAVPLRGPWSTVPYRRSWTDRRLHLSPFHLEEQTIDELRRQIVRFRPDFILGYSSSLYILTTLREAPIATDDWRPKAVLYSGDSLHPHQRERLESSFVAPIRGLYGCMERVISAADCAQGNLHLSLIDGYVEGQLTGEPPAEGPYVTGLLNAAMPLLRYDLGDALTFRRGFSCPCGRTLPVIEPVITREDDVLVTPSGRRVGSAVAEAFKGLPGLRMAQVVQRSARHLEVLVDTRERDYDPVAATVRKRLGRFTFGEMEVTVTRRAALAIRHGTKARLIINEHRPKLSGLPRRPGQDLEPGR